MVLLFSSCYFLAIHKQALPREIECDETVKRIVWVHRCGLVVGTCCCCRKGGTECNKWVRREDASTAVQSITASSRPGTASRGSVRSLRMITAPTSIAARNVPSSLPLKHCCRSVCARGEGSELNQRLSSRVSISTSTWVHMMMRLNKF
jgi:hypothetical protein